MDGQNGQEPGPRADPVDPVNRVKGTVVAGVETWGQVAWSLAANVRRPLQRSRLFFLASASLQLGFSARSSGIGRRSGPHWWADE